MRQYLIAAAAVVAAQAAAAEVTLINVFEVPEGQRAAVIEQWDAAREFLSAQPGYIATALHASIGDDARFDLINIAQWESIEAFRLATARLRASEAYPSIDGLGINPALYEVVRSDGAQGWQGPPWARRNRGAMPWSD